MPVFIAKRNEYALAFFKLRSKLLYLFRLHYLTSCPVSFLH